MIFLLNKKHNTNLNKLWYVIKNNKNSAEAIKTVSRNLLKILINLKN